MQKLIETFQELGINFKTDRISGGKLELVVMDDSDCEIATFWFYDDAEGSFHSVRHPA